MVVVGVVLHVDQLLVLEIDVENLIEDILGDEAEILVVRGKVIENLFQHLAFAQREPVKAYIDFGGMTQVVWESQLQSWYLAEKVKS